MTPLRIDRLETPRLLLRHLNDLDRDAFAAMNADPRVMEFLPSVATRAQSDAIVDRLRAHFDEHGFGAWCVVERNSGRFCGFAGLHRVTFAAPFAPTVEALWRFVPEVWGRGYATEAARAAIDDGFSRLDLPKIHTFTVPMNIRSRAVMERCGFTHVPDGDFDHPALPEGHRLRRHVLYVLDRPAR